MEYQPPGQGGARADAREGDIRVRHRRLLAAEPVTGRPRTRARAPGTHVQRAVLIAPGDAPPARAHRVDLKLRGLERVRADDVLRAHDGPAVADEAHVRAGAAHVVGDEVIETQRLGERHPAHDAAGRAREYRANGEPRRPLSVEHPAAGRHDEKGRAASFFSERSFQTVHVVLDPGAEIGVQGRRGEALELAVLGHDLVREREVHARQHFFEMLRRAPFVLPVGVGVQVADGEGFRTQALQAFGLLLDFSPPELASRCARQPGCVLRFRAASHGEQ